MQAIIRFFALVAVLGMAPLPAALTAGHPSNHPLTNRDRKLIVRLDALAVGSPRRAANWARRQPEIAGALLGTDGATLDIQFRDGAELAVLPDTALSSPGPVARRPARLMAQVRFDGAQGKALVLEPFATLLGHDSTWGQQEASILSQAGFSVDVLRDQQVTVASLENLGAYSAVYMETHSNVLPDGDAIVVSGESNPAPYASLFQDGSVMQALVAGEPDRTLYIAIKAAFIQHHVASWPDSGLVFINGCAVLNAPKFVDALLARNAGAVIGWDNESYNSVDEAGGVYVLQQLQEGHSVADAVSAATNAGLGTSDVNGNIAHLRYVGDGSDTLHNALVEATPTPTPTATVEATPTDTPAPTPTARPRPTATPQKTKAARTRTTTKPRATPTPTRKHRTVRKKSHKATKRITCKRGWHVVSGKCRPCKNGHCPRK